MSKDKVSIIITTKNESKNIRRCLLSCQKQDYKNIEIILIDNFSTDKTVEIAKKFTKKVFQKGHERSQQRNFGASLSSGKYLLFLDADMEIGKDCLLKALGEIKKGKFIVAFSEISTGKNFWEKSIALERNLYQKEQLLAAARLFPKELFSKIGGFDEKLIAGEDWDLSIRAQRLGYKLIFNSEPIIHHENVKNLKEILKKKRYYVKNIIFYVQKHPEEFAQQSSLKNRLGIYFKNWRRLSSQPFLTFGFLLLKAFIWLDCIKKNYGKFD
jgi:glycosyltransferase involved in cell wall biosynthesis